MALFVASTYLEHCKCLFDPKKFKLKNNSFSKIVFMKKLIVFGLTLVFDVLWDF